MKLPHQPYQYSADDLLRYHRGELTEVEMNRLERAALDDPFLADALDGYAKNDISKEDIDSLSTRISKRSEVPDKKRAPIWRLNPFLRAAAIVLFVASTLYMIISVSKRNRSTTLASREANTSVNDAIVSSDGAGKIVQQSYPATPDRATETSAAKKNEQLSNSSQEITSKSDTRPDDLATVETDMQVKDQNQLTTISTDVKEERSASQANAGSFLYSGKVVSDDGKPIVGAVVTIPEKLQQVTTDDSGKFSVTSTDTSVPVRLAAVGYNSRDLVLSETRQDIRMSPATPVISAEVATATPAGKMTVKKRESSDTKIKVVHIRDAEPRGGHANYENYVTTQMNQISDVRIHGTVSLSFLVAQDGSPTDIRVELPLSKIHDERSIKILITGPKFDPQGERRGKVDFHF